jgi:RND family efflux transporter MFP subunit
VNDGTEARLQREIEELRRQLGGQQNSHMGPPAGGWKPSSVTITALVVAAFVILAAAFFAGYIPLEKRDALVRAESQEREKQLPRLEVLRVGRSTDESALKLPGTLQAMTEAPILARADGYLKRRLVDLGDRVTAGQVLAEIDAPEVDQQIRQAEAAVEQAQAAVEQAEAALVQGKANRDLAKSTADRWKSLSAQGLVSLQENDQYQAQLNAQNANAQALEKAVSAQRSNLAAAKANVARLQEVQGYRVVKAPFDGVVILRNIDVGALVSAGNTLLYRIAQVGTLRTYVNVPQNDAGAVHVGQTAELKFENFPGQRFIGKVVRMANALDPTTRTMLVEIDIDNNRGILYPGMYGEVDFSGARRNQPLVVPAQAILVRADGAQVAIVQPDGTVHLQKVAVGRDFGDRVEVIQGLNEGATILATAGDAAQEGLKVEPVTSGKARP